MSNKRYLGDGIIANFKDDGVELSNDISQLISDNRKTRFETNGKDTIFGTAGLHAARIDAVTFNRWGIEDGGSPNYYYSNLSQDIDKAAKLLRRIQGTDYLVTNYRLTAKDFVK